MATIRNKEISKTGGVCLSFVAVLAIAAATLFTSGKPVEELSENAAVGRKSVITAAGATLPLPFYSEAFKMYWEKNDIQKPEESTDRLCRCGRSTYQSGTGQSAGKIYPCTYVHGGSDYRL